MAAEYGLYLSLLPDGQIKRDLTGPAGKVSLRDTTIQDEVILFSELNFEPYALVVDLVRNCAGSIMVQDEGHYGEFDMKEFQFMVDTVIDLVTTMEKESPLYGTLLRTQIEDQITTDDGTAMYPIRTGQELVALLTGVMQFQFVVNEVLHDLGEKTPLEPKKYEGLWEMPVTEVLTLEGDGLTTRYHFRSAVDYYHFLLLHFVADKPNVSLCQCCGRYFIPKTKKKTLYCDRILKDGKTCKEWGPILKHKLAARRNEVIEAFDRAKRKMYKRYERAANKINQKPSEKDLSYAECYEWLDRATKARDDYLEGKITVEDCLRQIGEEKDEDGNFIELMV